MTTVSAKVQTEEPLEPVSCSLRDLALYFLRLGTFGFGGPIALAGYMQRDLVERKRWISREDYLAGCRACSTASAPP
jgi:chromate transporter